MTPTFKPPKPAKAHPTSPHQYAPAPFDPRFDRCVINKCGDARRREPGGPTGPSSNPAPLPTTPPPMRRTTNYQDEARRPRQTPSTPATQESRVLDLLRSGEWVCGTVFLAAFMPRYSAVLWTLRHHDGHSIEGRKCEQHAIARHNIHEFRHLAACPIEARP